MGRHGRRGIVDPRHEQTPSKLEFEDLSGTHCLRSSWRLSLAFELANPDPLARRRRLHICYPIRTTDEHGKRVASGAACLRGLWALPPRPERMPTFDPTRRCDEDVECGSGPRSSPRHTRSRRRGHHVAVLARLRHQEERRCYQARIGLNQNQSHGRISRWTVRVGAKLRARASARSGLAVPLWRSARFDSIKIRSEPVVLH